MNNTVFIMSHNSPNKCITLDTLVRLGYTDNIYIIIDDEDNYVEKYKEKFSDKLIIFNKKYFLCTADSGFQTKLTPGCTLTARNAVEECARMLGLQHYIVLDDDIKNIQLTEFLHDVRKVKCRPIKNITEIFDLTIDYLLNANIACLSFHTQNLLMGGYEKLTSSSSFNRRTVSNCLIRNLKFPNRQFMCMYEDLCYSAQANKLGEPVFSLPLIRLVVEPQHTQKNNKQDRNSGNGDLYNIASYERNFLPVMAFPSCATVMEYNHKLTPRFSWNETYPKIISDKYKKKI